MSGNKDKSQDTFLDKGSWVSFGLVIGIATACITLGVMFNRIENLDTTVGTLNQSNQQTRETLTRLVQAVADLKSDFNDFKSEQQAYITSSITPEPTG